MEEMDQDQDSAGRRRGGRRGKWEEVE